MIINLPLSISSEPSSITVGKMSHTTIASGLILYQANYYLISNPIVCIAHNPMY